MEVVTVRSRDWSLAIPVLLTFLLAGCGGCAPSGDSPSGDGGQGAAGGDGGEKKPFVLGDLIEPFDPPTLEELEAKVEWVDMPVLDSLELLRRRQAEEGPPPVTVPEALKLRNTSKENNENILRAMGRLPADDDAVDYGAPIYRYTAADVRSTNPLMISSTTEFDVSGLTSFGLFSFDWDMNPFAASDTVASWQTSKDRMYDKVVMRDDLTWSDGEPITAHDVVFSFKVIMSDHVPVPAMRSGTDQIKWIEAYDDHTLVFFHKQPLATNIWNINFAVIPKHVYEKSIYEDPTLQDSPGHVKLENEPVTGGAYNLVARNRDQEIVLKRRESWYMHGGEQVRDKPYFEEVRFRIIKEPSVALIALKKGEIEEMTLNPEQWTSQTDDDEFYQKNTKAYGLEWTSFHFGYNLKTPFFSDVRVRKAMAYTLDYDEMLDKLLYGIYEPCNGPFHYTSRWAPKPPPPYYKQDLDKAEDLLDEAGWTDSDGDGIRDKEIDGRRRRFEFGLLVATGSTTGLRVCNLFKENLDQIGVICNVRPLEFTVLMEKNRTHDFEASFGGWGTGADPYTSKNIFGTDEGRNYGQYSNPEIDRLYDLGEREFDLDERAKIYGRIHQILYEDQVYTWLFYRNAFYGFSKQLRGYNFSPRGPYHYGPGFGSIWKPVPAALP